ncbi:MAG: ribonuclease [Gammaproteobacteria bacterium]|nr:ribonuclease [Gammaproteobacteria bacterium]MDD2929307.1 ribonuclease domain-containing protein [Sideroxydans sp.]MDD5471585.1 ribonuclease domain-containing protein [Sideroxydans sp.]
MRRAAQAGWGLLIALLLCLPFAQAREQHDPSLVAVSVAQLPPEAGDTLQLIKRGGPFPYARDGIEFKNRERILPVQPRRYYREYTVKTPGVKHRGARRIVCGVAPARGRPEGSPLLRSDPSPLPECYYTDDHYRSFRRIKE